MRRTVNLGDLIQKSEKPHQAMRKALLSFSLCFCVFLISPQHAEAAPKPEHYFLFVFNTREHDGKTGLLVMEVQKKLKIRDFNHDKDDPKMLVIEGDRIQPKGVSEKKRGDQSVPVIKLIFKSVEAANKRLKLYDGAATSLSFIGEEAPEKSNELVNVRVLPTNEKIQRLQEGGRILADLLMPGYQPGHEGDTKGLEVHLNAAKAHQDELEAKKMEYRLRNKKGFTYEKHLGEVEKRLGKMKEGDAAIAHWEIKRDALLELIAERDHRSPPSNQQLPGYGDLYPESQGMAGGHRDVHPGDIYICDVSTSEDVSPTVVADHGHFQVVDDPVLGKNSRQFSDGVTWSDIRNPGMKWQAAFDECLNLNPKEDRAFIQAELKAGRRPARGFFLPRKADWETIRIADFPNFRGPIWSSSVVHINPYYAYFYGYSGYSSYIHYSFRYDPIAVVCVGVR